MPSSWIHVKVLYDKLFNFYDEPAIPAHWARPCEVCTYLDFAVYWDFAFVKKLRLFYDSSRSQLTAGAESNSSAAWLVHKRQRSGVKLGLIKPCMRHYRLDTVRLKEFNFFHDRKSSIFHAFCISWPWYVYSRKNSPEHLSNFPVCSYVWNTKTTKKTKSFAPGYGRTQ